MSRISRAHYPLKKIAVNAYLNVGKEEMEEKESEVANAYFRREWDR